MPNDDLCVAKEVAVISTERRNLSHDAQLTAGARVVALGDDVTLLVFHSLRLSDRITVSHVCAFWRALALGDPLLWTPALHIRRTSAFPLLWSRTAPAPIEVDLDIAPLKGPRNALTCLSRDISRITKLTITASAYISLPVCDIVATDSGDRSRYIRGAEFEQMRTYPRLWSSLVSLTICGDIKDQLERPPPHCPSLQSLRLLYHPISALLPTAGTIDPVQPWKLDNGDWQCPNLHTVEFALVLLRFPDDHLQEIGSPLRLPSSAVLRFVTRELSHSRVTRVIVKGDNIRIQSDSDEELQFVLSCDMSDSGIETVEREFMFRGFDASL